MRPKISSTFLIKILLFIYHLLFMSDDPTFIMSTFWIGMNGILEDVFDESCDLDSIKDYVIPKLLSKVSIGYPIFSNAGIRIIHFIKLLTAFSFSILKMKSK